MKKIILLALTALMMVGCDEPKSINHIEGFNIVKIDSCEYIEQYTYMHLIYIHKGNCRFCEERDSIKWEKRKKELEELVIKLTEK